MTLIVTNKFVYLLLLFLSSNSSAILLLKSDHESEVKKAQILLDELKQCCEAGCDVNALMNLRIELEEKHKLEVEELRTYFEQKCADMEKK